MRYTDKDSEQHLISFFYAVWSEPFCCETAVGSVCPGGVLGIKATSAFWATSLFVYQEEKSCRQKLNYFSH